MPGENYDCAKDTARRGVVRAESSPFRREPKAGRVLSCTWRSLHEAHLPCLRAHLVRPEPEDREPHPPHGHPHPRARTRTDSRLQVLSSRGGTGAPSTRQPRTGQARSLMSPPPLPCLHLPGSLAVPPEIPSRFKFDWVKVDQRKVEAREGRSRRAEN